VGHLPIGEPRVGTEPLLINPRQGFPSPYALVLASPFIKETVVLSKLTALE